MAEQRNLCAAKDFARAPACFGQNRVKIDDLAGTNQK
jgi:hypothetical protein